MVLVDFEGNVSPAQGAICVELTIGVRPFQLLSLSLRLGDLIIFLWVGIGYMSIATYPLQCINVSSNGSEIQWKWSKEKPP
jgi:hypothetical protein